MKGDRPMDENENTSKWGKDLNEDEHEIANMDESYYSQIRYRQN